MDFKEIATASPVQQIRAWSIEKALEYSHSHRETYGTAESIITAAKMFEDYVMNGDVSPVITAAIEEGLIEGRFEVKEKVEEWFSDVALDDLFKVEGWVSPDKEKVDGA